MRKKEVIWRHSPPTEGLSGLKEAMYELEMPAEPTNKHQHNTNRLREDSHMKMITLHFIENSLIFLI